MIWSIFQLGTKSLATFSNLRPSKIYPNWDFWFENKPSGNPDLPSWFRAADLGECHSNFGRGTCTKSSKTNDVRLKGFFFCIKFAFIVGLLTTWNPCPIKTDRFKSSWTKCIQPESLCLQRNLFVLGSFARRVLARSVCNPGGNPTTSEFTTTNASVVHSRLERFFELVGYVFVFKTH
jgi:hypothetical protein